MTDAPLCLGCNCTIAETAIYCRKCYLAIKAHRNPEPVPDTSQWPAEERGDRVGLWDERCANCEELSGLDDLDCWKRWKAGLKYPAWWHPPKVDRKKMARAKAG